MLIYIKYASFTVYSIHHRFTSYIYIIYTYIIYIYIDICVYQTILTSYRFASCIYIYIIQ